MWRRWKRCRAREQSSSPYRPGPDTIALIQYTSGSTGDPKGVVLTHANLLANIRTMGEALDASSSDVFVSWLPLDRRLAWHSPLWRPDGHHATSRLSRRTRKMAARDEPPPGHAFGSAKFRLRIVLQECGRRGHRGSRPQLGAGLRLAPKPATRKSRAKRRG